MHKRMQRNLVHIVLNVLIVGFVAATGVHAAASADPDGDFAFAEHLMRDGMYDLAAQQLQLFINNHPEHPKTPDAFLLLATAYTERDEFARAADTYQGFTVKYPQDVRVREFWLKQAQLRARAGQHTDAAREFLQLADAYPESDFADDALLGAGTSYVKLRDLERAERTLTRLLTRYPNGNAVSAARVLLARVRYQRGDTDGAEQVVRPVIQQRTLSNDVTDALLIGTKIALSQNNIPEARRLSDRLVAQAPGDVRAWEARMVLGQALLDRGAERSDRETLNQAAELYKEAARRATTVVLSEEALFNLARVRELQETPNLALTNWQDFLNQYPTSNRKPRAMLGLGRAHLASGNDSEGIFALEELLSAYPDSAESIRALGDLADYYLNRGDGASALAYYERQLDATPSGPDQRQLMLTIARLRATEMNDPAQARALFLELTESDDNIAVQAQFGLAVAERSLGNIDAAESAYAQVTRRFPTHELATAARDSLTLIRHFLKPDISGAMEAMLAVDADELIAGSDPTTALRERKLALAEVRFSYLNDYEGTVQLLESYLADPNTSKPDRAEHLQAQSYLRLSTRAKLARNSTEETAAREKALAALARLATRYPESELADDAFIETTEARLLASSSEPSPQAIVEAYQGFFDRYPNSDRRDYVLVRVAECAVRGAAQGVGNPQQSLRQFDRAIEFAPNGPVLDRALFGSALILRGQGQSDEAKRRLQRLIAERPLSDLLPESRYQLAMIYLDENQPNAAAREFEKLLRSGDRSRDINDIRARLILAYEKTGSYQQILPVAEEMRESDNPTAAAQGARALARAMVEIRHLADAEAVLAEELRVRPDAPDADSLTIRHAEILIRINRIDLVAGVLGGFERKFPRSTYVPAAWRMLAHVQFDLNAYEEALASYRRVLQADGRDKESRLGEVVALYRLGRTDEARQRERELRDMTRLTAEDEVRLSLEEGHALFRARDYMAAIEAFAEVVKNHPNSEWADDALLAQGRAGARSGRIEPAAFAFQKLIRDYPDSPLRQEAAFELGNAYFGMRFYEQSAESYQRVLEIDTTSRFAPDALWNLVVSYEALQRFDSAIRTMRQFLMKYPDHERAPRALVKIAEDLNRLGEFEDAVAAYHEALERVSGEDLAVARFGLGEAYFNLGEYRLAMVEWLKMAYHGQTQSSWAITALYRAAKANEKMGRFADAATLYRKIVTIEGENSDWGRSAAMELLRLQQTEGVESVQ